ncbi:hypothetical protein EKO04_008661 [Ascochyta lentis]|uniref:DUF6594 domain-containing protein n=1 Tax=Ascochyta lentis TaxID=205686 RepID=A0A8H7MC61_9PLEO|nr:hypothetical protein EKO04_008661 [Ascochyta lentis]
MATIARRVRTFMRSNSEKTLVRDVELAPEAQPDSVPPLRGVPSLAAFMASNSNSESFIFKRFDRLAARNLLYLQSELAFLQEELDVLDGADHGDVEARKCARSWEDFERVRESDERQRERWELVVRIRVCLKEYQETLIRQSTIAGLAPPSTNVLDAFNAEFYGRVPSLVGASKNLYQSEGTNIQDLVQLHSTERKDRVSAFLAKYLFRWLQTSNQDSQKRFDPRVTYLYTQRLDLFVELFYAVLSIVLLLGAILSLYFVNNAIWRIAIIVLFTLAFAACAVFLADGRRLAVFGACAAYAAVLVVFVSGNWEPGND